MTYYPGNKKKIGQVIADVIYKNSINISYKEDFKIKGYIEPFIGMAGVYNHIPKLFKNKKMKYFGGDRNPYLIKLLKGLQHGFSPPIKVSKNEYYYYKDNDIKTLKSIWVGFACAFRGVFRSTYNPNINLESLSLYSKEIGKNIKNVSLSTGDYTQFNNFKNCIIYCDPPYKLTQNSYYIGNIKNNYFNYEEFIIWIREMSKNNIIFISEYTKPCREAKLIWENGNEKLYII